MLLTQVRLSQRLACFSPNQPQFAAEHAQLNAEVHNLLDYMNAGEYQKAQETMEKIDTIITDMLETAKHVGNLGGNEAQNRIIQASSALLERNRLALKAASDAMQAKPQEKRTREMLTNAVKDVLEAGDELYRVVMRPIGNPELVTLSDLS